MSNHESSVWPHNPLELLNLGTAPPRPKGLPSHVASNLKGQEHELMCSRQTTYLQEYILITWLYVLYEVENLYTQTSRTYLYTQHRAVSVYTSTEMVLYHTAIQDRLSYDSLHMLRLYPTIPDSLPSQRVNIP